ncbi:MAG: hypothetical protein Q9199_003547 [Rusavskia elegans]
MPTITTATTHHNKSIKPPYGPDPRWLEPVLVLIISPFIIYLGFKLWPVVEMAFNLALSWLKRKWRRIDSSLKLVDRWRSIKILSRTFWPWLTSSLISFNNYRRNRGYHSPPNRSWMDNEHELVSLSDYMDGAAEGNRRISGETAVPTEPLERGVDVRGTQSAPGSMDITSVPPVTEEIRRELSAEARENVDIANKGIIRATDRHRPGYEPQASEC